MQNSHFVAFVVLLAAVMAGGSQSVPSHAVAVPNANNAASPDAIYFNARIYTVDRSHPFAEALAVRGDRIVAVGKSQEVLALAGRDTRRIDLHGRFVMPGFNDAHVHLASAGLAKLEVDLEGSRSLAEMQERIRAALHHYAPGEWIQGSGWDHTLWPERKFPTREDLDGVTAGHPAFFVRVDGHVAVANTLALRESGITRSTANPPGGEIERDTSGEPDGILEEGAQELVTRHIPPPSHAVRLKALQLAMQDALAHGVTSTQDFSTWDDFLAFEELERDGRLKFRVTEWLPFNALLTELERERSQHSRTDAWLHTGMLKGFMDGSLGSRTAALLEPYTDQPSTRGLPQYDPADLNAMARERARAGFQLGFHAIGDAGVRMALDAIAAAIQATGGIRENMPGGMGAAEFPGPRHRIEHIQVVAPSDLPRFRQLRVIASVQPNHLLTDMRWAEQRIGPERARYSYLWRTFLNEGVPLAFGTDYPVEPITPFRGLYAALTRQSEDGSQTYFPAERLTREQAIYAYTMGSALAEFAEKTKGSLTVGKLADFVALSDDLLSSEPRKLLAARVELTVVGGQVMYDPQGITRSPVQAAQQR